MTVDRLGWCAVLAASALAACAREKDQRAVRDPQPVLAVSAKFGLPPRTVVTWGPVSFTPAVRYPVDALSILLDGQVIPEQLRAGEPSSVWLTGTAEGTHMLVLRATESGKTFDSEPVTVVIDRTPPTLEFTPSEGFPIGGVLRVVASEPLDPIVVGQNSVRVSCTDERIRAPWARAVLSDDRRELGIALDPALANCAALRVDVVDVVRDAAGNWPDPSAWAYGAQPVDVTLRRTPSFAYVNGTIELAADVVGGTPDYVDFGLMGNLAARVSEPPYAVTIDTRTWPEGTYTPSARAYRQDVVTVARGTDFTIDRTPPELQYCVAGSSFSSAWIHDPVRCRFSEPVDPQTTAGITFLDATGAPLETLRSAVPGYPDTIELVVDGERSSAAVSVAMTGVTDRAGNPLATIADAPTFTWDAWQSITSYAASGATLALTRDPGTGRPDRYLDAGVRAQDGGGWVVDADFLTDGDWWHPIFLPEAAHAGPVVPDRVGAALRADGARAALAWTEAPDGTPTVVRAVVAESFAKGSAFRPVVTPLGTVPVREAGAAAAGPAVAFDGDGSLVVAWREDGTQTRFAAARWTGTAWAALGDAMAAASASAPELAIDAVGRLVLAIVAPDATATPAVHVFRLEDGAWIPLGAPVHDPTGTGAAAVALALLPDGAPVVAWRERVGGVDVVRVAARTAGEWAVDKPAGDAAAGPPAIAADRAGRVTVATVEPVDAGAVIRVRRSGPDGWTLLDGIASPAASPERPALAVDPHGGPVVFWWLDGAARAARWNE